MEHILFFWINGMCCNTDGMYMEDGTHARNLVVLALTASLVSLILAGLIDTDSDPLGSGTSFHVDTLAKNS